MATTKWEYEVQDIDNDIQYSFTLNRMLNDKGKNGWELVGIIGTYAIFKRPISY